MIVSVLHLPVRAGSEEAIVRFYAEHDVFGLAAQVGGFRSGSLLEPTTAGSAWLVVAEWDDVAAYERWLAAPARAELSELLAPHLDGTPAGSSYRRRPEACR